MSNEYIKATREDDAVLAAERSATPDPIKWRNVIRDLMRCVTSIIIVALIAQGFGGRLW